MSVSSIIISWISADIFTETVLCMYQPLLASGEAVPQLTERTKQTGH